MPPLNGLLVDDDATSPEPLGKLVEGTLPSPTGHGRGPAVPMISPRDSTILVVDDDEDTASLLCELLQKRGYRAEAFTSGSRCLEYLRNGVADVVVDVQIREMTGIELCRELAVRHPDLLAIVLTGGDLQHAISAIGTAAYDFIRKPVNLQLLEIAIQRALASRPATAERES